MLFICICMTSRLNQWSLEEANLVACPSRTPLAFVESPASFGDLPATDLSSRTHPRVLHTLGDSPPWTLPHILYTLGDSPSTDSPAAGSTTRHRPCCLAVIDFVQARSPSSASNSCPLHRLRQSAIILPPRRPRACRVDFGKARP